MDEKFIFGEKSGGHDTIKCFNGKEGDRIDICGDFHLTSNERCDVVICWGDHNTVTLEGVQHVEECWII